MLLLHFGLSQFVLLWTIVISCYGSKCLNFITDCGASPNTSIDNTFAFTTCQQKLANGGCIEISGGKYDHDVLNVHLISYTTYIHQLYLFLITVFQNQTHLYLLLALKQDLFTTYLSSVYIRTAIYMHHPIIVAIIIQNF